MLVTMACEFPNPCWFALNAQPVGEPSFLTNNEAPEPTEVTSTYIDAANKYWDIFYTGWKNRPEIKSWWSNTPYGLLANAVDEVINLQIEAMDHIRHGGAENKNLYTDVEQDRVDTIGFKPVWSPGGFQV